MKLEQFNVETMEKEDLLNINGGFIGWIALTILVACIDSPDDFVQGLKDSV